MMSKIKYLVLLLPLFFLWRKDNVVREKKIVPSKPLPQTNQNSALKRESSKSRKSIYLTAKSSRASNFINQENDNWMRLLEDNLLRFQDPTITVDILHLESIILFKYNQKQFAETVRVTYKNPQGIISSFNAYIDSENGKIIGKPWNKTVIEFKNMPKLKSSGVIKQIIKKDTPGKTP